MHLSEENSCFNKVMDIPFEARITWFSFIRDLIIGIHRVACPNPQPMMAKRMRLLFGILFLKLSRNGHSIYRYRCLDDSSFVILVHPYLPDCLT